MRAVAPNEKPRLDWTYVVFIGLLHIGAVASFFFFSWANLASFLILYVISGLGITIGYHRLLTHRSFHVPKFVEVFWTTCGSLALEGGPISWVANHRLHHKESDTELDPHNINDGFWWAHFGWIFMRYSPETERTLQTKFAPDLQKSAYYRWLDRYAPLPNILVGLLLLAIGGWTMVLWGSCLRIVLMFHATWFVNSAAHLWGYRHWPEEQATNNWWVALVSFGEGWHNAHHKHPASARHGLRTFEVDPSWMIIWTMSKLGMATKIRLPHRSELPWLADRTAPTTLVSVVGELGE